MNFVGFIDGLNAFIPWLVGLGIWCFALNLFADDLAKKIPDEKIWKRRKIQIFQLSKIFAFCLIFTAVAGRGGEICDSFDMFGCNSESGEYRDRWSFDSSLEFFMKFFGVVACAWVMAQRGYRLEKRS